ncbi:MAG: iron donor protein CyaY [Rickettsiales bacterium]
MDKKQFKLNLKNTFNKIFSILEKKEEDDQFEYEDNGEIIEIKYKNKLCAINFHRITKQIWVASNIDGAFHFDYNEKNDKWISSKGFELFETLNKLLK